MAKSAAPTERAVRFQLNQHVFLPWAEGVRGEVLELRRDQAEKLLARGCGEIVGAEEPSESGN